MKEGWNLVKIGDVCKTAAGGTPLKSEKRFYEGGTIPWLLSGEVCSAFIASAKNSITDLGLKESSAKVFPRNTVLVAMYGATAGQVGILRIDAATNQAVCGIYPNEHLLPEYLYYALLQKKADLVATASGNAQPNISQIKVRNTEVPLPPLPEQKRIVGILDEAFAGISTTVANTEKNLANARELFESYLNSVFSRRDEGWVEKPLAEFVDSISTGPFGSLLHKADYVLEGVPLVNPINIVGNKIVPDERKMIGDDTKARLQAYILKEGDVVIARRGEIGRCAVVAEKQKGWVCGTGCFFIRPSGAVDSHFLAHLLRSVGYLKELERLSSGATMLNLNNKALSTLRVSIPSIWEQKKAVGQVADLLAQCQAVESIYQQKLTALAELKQSLLQKAFSGELTAGKIASVPALKEEACP